MEWKDINIEKLRELPLAELVRIYHELGIDAQIDYDKFYLYSIITHSTAIEGSTVTELENQLLFDEGITAKGRSLQEQMMNLDLKNAYEWGMEQIRQHPAITIDFLRTLSAKVMARTGNEYNTLNGSFSAAKGDIRLLNVTAGFGGKSYMNFLKVPMYLEKFCKELNERRSAIDASNVQSIYEMSFWAHYELVTIHPWADGNGRATRLLMNLLQMEFGVLPMKVTKEEKGEYIQALIDTRDKEDISIFLSTMTHLQEQHLREEIIAFVDSMLEGGQKTEKVDRNDTKDDTKELSERQKVIVSLIQEDDTITINGMIQKTNVSSITIKRDLAVLQELNVIKREGGRKQGRWVIVAKGKELEG